MLKADLGAGSKNSIWIVISMVYENYSQSI